MNKNDLLLYVITDCDNLQGEALLARTEAILASGATMLAIPRQAQQSAPGCRSVEKPLP